jgi:hypothetical protein
MIRVSLTCALALAALVGGCQSYDMAGPTAAPVAMTMAPTPLDGAWSSTDGVFVANFENGNFTSRFIKTSEILAQGTYTVSGANVRLDWISVATQQRRSASCFFTAADTVSCNQDGGGSFDLKRSV